MARTEYEAEAVVATSQAEANAGYDNGAPFSVNRRFPCSSVAFVACRTATSEEVEIQA